MVSRQRGAHGGTRPVRDWHPATGRVARWPLAEIALAEGDDEGARCHLDSGLAEFTDGGESASTTWCDDLGKGRGRQSDK
jgi:hypothetical protein